MPPRKKPTTELPPDDTLFGGPLVVVPDPEKAKKDIFRPIKLISERRPCKIEDVIEDYDAFMTNRAFSLTEDTVLLAAQMNQRDNLPKDMQIAYYLNTVRPRARWPKWPKALVDERIDIIARYYGMSQREARIHSPLITDEQIQRMRDLLGDDVKLQRR